jgi:putative redox protein
MTLQMYARRKKWPVDEVKVHLSYKRSYKEDCEHCDVDERRLDEFDREIEIIGAVDQGQLDRLLEIADKCPVHKTLMGSSVIHSTIKKV